MFNIAVPLLRQYAIIITVNLLALCVGMDLGWTSPVLVKLRDPSESPLSRPITEREGGWIVSIGLLFSLFTLPCLGLLMDNIGRNYSVLVACLPKIVAGILNIFATDLWMLLVARVINQVTSTAAFVIIMVYATEISSKEIRGSLGTIASIFSNLGVLVMLGIGPYISYRNLCIMMTASTVCASIPLLFIPNTPYSLYNRGKIEDAKKILTFFRGSQAIAEEELKEYSECKTDHKISGKEILRNKVYLKSLVIVIIIGIGLQMCGFNFVSFYLQTILELSNTSVSSALGSVIIGLIQLTSSVVANMVIDRFGRKPILVSTLLAMAAGMIGLGVFFMVKQRGVISGWLNYLPLISIAIFTCAYSAGIGCLYFVIVAEVLDGPIRAIGSALSAVVTYAMLFLLLQYAMTIISAMGADATFMMFGALCIAESLFIFFFIPETKNKTITEIQRALGAVKEDQEKATVSSGFENLSSNIISQ